jgi:CRP-like cAMP-binding protein
MEMKDDFVIDVLKHADIFEDLDQRSLHELSQLFLERVYNEGETIFEEESIGTSMMIVMSGKVRITQMDGSQSEEALIMLKKGDVFGEMNLFEGLPRSAAAIAHTNVILLEIRREEFLHFIMANADEGVQILMKLGRIMSARLREADLKLKTFIKLNQWN